MNILINDLKLADELLEQHIESVIDEIRLVREFFLYNLIWSFK